MPKKESRCSSVQGLETKTFERQCQYSLLFGRLEADEQKVCELQQSALPPSVYPFVIVNLPGLPSLFLHTASNNKLEPEKRLALWIWSGPRLRPCFRFWRKLTYDDMVPYNYSYCASKTVYYAHIMPNRMQDIMGVSMSKGWTTNTYTCSCSP